MTRYFSFISLSLGMIVGFLFAASVVNVATVASTPLAILLGSAFGVALTTLWHVERMRRQFRREREQVAIMLGAERN